MLPPLTSSMKVMPEPRSPGCSSIFTAPNWPECRATQSRHPWTVVISRRSMMVDFSQRRQVITESMDSIKQVLREQGVTRASLDVVKPLLGSLASRKELWMTPEFPEPVMPELTAFYLLHKDPETGYALYLNIMRT